MSVLTRAEDISNIAFGFMGSKALFAALHNKVFTHLSESPKTPEELAAVTALDPERAQTLLTALAGLDLVAVEDGKFSNSPAAENFLVKGAKYDFGDYLRLQVDRQMYSLLDQIENALIDELPEGATGSYAEWFSDPEEARIYSESQHAGSLGPARGLAKQIDLTNATSLLDVGGGTGAYSITLCNAFPNLKATVIDFPNVAKLGRNYVAEAGLADKIRYIEGNALETVWPKGQDAILMSYLFSGVPDTEHERLIKQAYDCLNPGGIVMIHDFVVHADRTGPKNAALWQLQHTAFTPHARSLDDEWLESQLKGAGFGAVSVEPMIPAMTMLAKGTRPR
ncbi:methyltransferase domain-containing protein [Hwanghaeella grinnelliae]|uniref:Methyltransferase domain-containing protein n=1 Tax=Hwanghaeella grinnelliae TaxID=2500179 RepID=A0A3S2W8U3_9PROT|nr:methyltransferase [Hwanghaeella grinnelliae]RVU36033.1 methyltransferase domain-containing protein [Hwanghaeella grinnelliae]